MSSELKTRYSDEELAEFEQIIDKKLAESQEQLDYYMEQLQSMGMNDLTKVRGLDDGNGTLESERLNSMALRIKKHIQHLENAKMRIHNKVYGICRDTGKLISKERLKAVPHATLSIEAKQSEVKRR
jgi:RNA polymerase-binding transcription factor DksA